MHSSSSPQDPQSTHFGGSGVYRSLEGPRVQMALSSRCNREVNRGAVSACVTQGLGLRVVWISSSDSVRLPPKLRFSHFTSHQPSWGQSWCNIAIRLERLHPQSKTAKSQTATEPCSHDWLFFLCRPFLSFSLSLSYLL